MISIRLKPNKIKGFHAIVERPIRHDWGEGKRMDAREHTAVFIGHNECYGITAEAVSQAVITLINQGVTTFVSGGQGGFDRLCAGCVNKLRQQYPGIRNLLVIPYLDFTIFDKTLFDEIVYPDDFEKYHYKAAIPARNRYMVDNAAHAICYVNHGWGGAAKTYDRAVRKKLNIINLGSYTPDT